MIHPTPVSGTHDSDALNEDAALFRQLVSQAPDGVLLVAGGRIVFANPAAAHMAGADDAEAMLGRPIDDFLHPEDRAQTLARMASIIQGEIPEPMERRMVRVDGSVIWTEARGVLSRYRGEPAVLAIVRDVHARREVESRLDATMANLRSANEELSQFAEATSQDLREPLRTVGSYLQLLSRRSRDQLDAESQDYLDEALKWLRRMDALIEDLKAFSRINTHGRPLRAVSLTTVLTAATRRLAQDVQDSGFTWKADDLPDVLGDEPQLVQVFSHLISNAIKYARPDEPPFMSVRAQRDATGLWCISLADNGIGIEAPYRQRVFEIFRRLHTRDQTEGAGIGLAICRRIIERHGGSIWLEPEPGGGTRFRFTLQPVPDRG